MRNLPGELPAIAGQVVLRHAGMAVQVHEHVELGRLEVERRQPGGQRPFKHMAGARHRHPVAEARIVPGRLG